MLRSHPTRAYKCMAAWLVRGQCASIRSRTAESGRCVWSRRNTWKRSTPRAGKACRRLASLPCAKFAPEGHGVDRRRAIFRSGSSAGVSTRRQLASQHELGRETTARCAQECWLSFPALIRRSLDYLVSVKFPPHEATAPCSKCGQVAWLLTLWLCRCRCARPTPQSSMIFRI